MNTSPLETQVFPGDIEQSVFIEILDTLDHVKPVFVSREEFQNKNWNFLIKNWEDKFWDFYDLYLPKDLQYGETLEIIDILTNKFNLQNYTNINELLSQTKVMIWIILREYWVEWGKKLEKLQEEYNLSNEFVEKIKNHKIKTTVETKQFIKDIKAQRKNSQETKWISWNKEKLWTSWDTEISQGFLKDIFWEEFEKVFFRKWVDMLRLWLMTITQSEQETLEESDWEVIIRHKISSNKLDKEERLLRDKIGIKQLKKNLDEIRENWTEENIKQAEIEATNKILKFIYEYPYQATNNRYWYQPNKILKEKEIYCVWFSLLWHAFLSELGIEHYWLDMPLHSALEVIIWWKKYFFDATYDNKICEFEYWNKVWALYEMILGNGYSFYEKEFAISWNPEKILFSQIYNNKWPSLFKLWRYKEAIKMHEQAIKLNPRDSYSYNNKWASLSKLWRDEKAIEMYDKAIKLNPRFSDSYYNKWNSLFELRRYEEAIEMYEEAIKLNPRVSGFYYNKWASLFTLWRYEEAIEMYEEAIKLNPRDSDSYYNKWASLSKLSRTNLDTLYKYASATIDNSYWISNIVWDHYGVLHVILQYQKKKNKTISKRWKLWMTKAIPTVLRI